MEFYEGTLGISLAAGFAPCGRVATDGFIHSVRAAYDLSDHRASETPLMRTRLILIKRTFRR